MNQVTDVTSSNTAKPSTAHHPQLNEGEFYEGLILGKNGEPDYHLIGVGDVLKGVTWKQAMDKAKELGLDLPNRRELGLGRVNAAEHFENDWYWSNEQHADSSHSAWCQNFGTGSQDYDGKYYELAARFVRRQPV